MVDERKDTEQRAEAMNLALARTTLKLALRRAVLAAICILVAGVAIYLAMTMPSVASLYLLVAVGAGVGLLISGILYLDAYSHWREIKGRKWTSSTPRFRSKHSPRGADSATGQIVVKPSSH